MKTYGTVHRDNRHGSWVICAEPQVLIRLKRIFPRAKKQAGNVVLHDTPEVCADLRWVCERWPLRFSSADWSRLCERGEDQRALVDSIDGVLTGQVKPRDLRTALPLRSYQAEAVELLMRVRGLLVGDELGVGKTAIAIGMLALPETRPCAIVTATFLPPQWERELQRFLPGIRTHIARKAAPYDVMVRGTGKPFRLPGNPLEAALFPDVVILSYSKLAGWADTLGQFCRSVVFDEAHELRTGHERSGSTPASRKCISAKVLADGASYRLGLTGTPVFNYGVEMRNILDVLSPDSLGTRAEFATEWCADNKKVKNPVALGTHLRSTGLYIRRTRADVGRELPPLTIVPVPLEGDGDPLRGERGLAVELARKILSRGPRGESFAAAGELDWRLRQATGIDKAPAVAGFVQLLVEQGEPVILAGWHKAVYALWKEAFQRAGIPFAMFTGDESQPEKHAAIEQFTGGKAKILVMSLRAGSGIDGLQHSSCRNVVFGELDWSPQMHRQLIGRLHRDGQEKHVTAYYLISDTGSDPIIVDVLGVKRQQAIGIEDPLNQDIAPNADRDRARKLAEAYLLSIGEKPPEPSNLEPELSL